MFGFADDQQDQGRFLGYDAQGNERWEKPKTATPPAQTPPPERKSALAGLEPGPDTEGGGLFNSLKTYLKTLMGDVNPAPAIQAVAGLHGGSTVGVRDMGQGIVQSHLDELEQAQKDWDAGNHRLALQHMVAGIIPILGPATAKGVEDIKAGNTAEGAAHLTAVAAPFLIPGAVKGGRTIVNAAADRGTLATNLETGAATRTADFMAPKGGSQAPRFRQMAEKVAPEVIKEPGISSTSRQKFNEGAVKKYLSVTDEMDSVLDDAMGQRPVHTAEIDAALQAEIDNLTSKAVKGSRTIPEIVKPGTPGSPGGGPGPSSKITPRPSTPPKLTGRQPLPESRQLPARGETGPTSSGAKLYAGDEGIATSRDTYPFDPNRGVLDPEAINPVTTLPPDLVAQTGPGLGRLRTPEVTVPGTPPEVLAAAGGENMPRGVRPGMTIPGQMGEGPVGNPGAGVISEVLPGEQLPRGGGWGVASAETAAPRFLEELLRRAEQNERGVTEDPNAVEATRPWEHQIGPKDVPAGPTKGTPPVKAGRRIGKDVLPAPVRSQVGVLRQMQKEIRQLGPVATYDAIRNIRSAWDKVARVKYNPSMTQDFLKAEGTATGAAKGTGAMRTALAKASPEAAEAFQSYSTWQTAMDVLEAAEEVRGSRGQAYRPNTGTLAKAAGFGGAAYMATHSIETAVGAALIEPALEAMASKSPTIQIKVARAMQRIADGLRNRQRANVEAGVLDADRLSGVKRTPAEVKAAVDAILKSKEQPKLTPTAANRAGRR
jgi:hypothetical protein